MCDTQTLKLFKSLAEIPMNELTFPDLMFLTSHDKCCGEKLRTEKAKIL